MSRASMLVAPTTSTSVEDDDNSLVARARGGDDRAFEILFARYRPRITSYVQGMVSDHGRAEDITQEVFISALRRMRATERPIAFRPWLYEIAKNASIDQYRRSRRSEELSFDADDGLGAADRSRLVAADPTPDERLAVKQRLNDLCGAFGDLSDNHHQILVLRELEGMSYREIGDRMGMSRPAVESTLFRARRRLTQEYDELVTGRRCLRVQSAISAAEEGDAIAARDRRRLARHLSYCQPCRRCARQSGVEIDVAARPTVAARLGALLPLPFLLRARRSPDDLVVGPASSQGTANVANWSATVTSSAEPLGSGLAKIATAAATLAVATVGSGVGDGGKSPVFVHGAADRTRPAAAVPTARSGGDAALLRPAGRTFLGRFARPGGAAAIARVTLPSPSTSAPRARGDRGRDRPRDGAREDDRRARDGGHDTSAPSASRGDSAVGKRGAGAAKEGGGLPRVELPRVDPSKSVRDVSKVVRDASESVRDAGRPIEGAVKRAITTTTTTTTTTGGSIAPPEVTTPSVAPVASSTTVHAPATPDVGAVTRTIASTAAAAAAQG